MKDQRQIPYIQYLQYVWLDEDDLGEGELVHGAPDNRKGRLALHLMSDWHLILFNLIKIAVETLNAWPEARRNRP